MMIPRKFWSPSLTSQFLICPVPFHLDTYRGCVYNCSYCFARDFVMFSRRNLGERRSSVFLEGNRPDLFKRWFDRVVLERKYDYSRGHEVAVQEGIPLEMGATADPFPPAEFKEKITYGVLKALDEHDYPVEIQTN